MNEVYSRWPGEPPADGMPSASLDGRHLPDRGAAGKTARVARRGFGLSLAPAGLAIFGAAALVLEDWGMIASDPTVLVLAAATLAAAGGSLWSARRSSARADAAERRFGAVFERAGISIWDEDWSAVGAAILELKRAGVDDLRGHFTAHPEQAHALRRQVVIRDVNAFTVQMMGATDKGIFLGPLDRVLPNTDQTFIEWLVAFGRGDRFYRSEAHLTRPDGSTLDCLFTAALPTDLEEYRTILVSCFDISDYKAAQARLVAAETDVARAARISTVGALTATISHDINQPLAAIVSSAGACLRWLNRDAPELAEALDSARQVAFQAERAREVVERARSFLGNSPRRTAKIDLVETMRGAIAMIDRDLRALGASIHFDADEGIPSVVADPIQLQQVLINLMINGAQAMEEVAGPRDLTVTVRQLRGLARIEVGDKGRGIAAQHTEVVYDPFYSTRHDGMGMGLAICRTCIEAHGGRLHFRSGAGGGTVFSFDLPLADA